MLSPGEGSLLVRVAREAIRDALGDERARESLPDGAEPTPALQARSGAFVTLKIGGRLRGCVGMMESDLPLIETVFRLAPRAALEDTRFAPLQASELPAVRISVSVLTPLEEIDGPERIVIGKHGVQLRENDRRAVFLPEVAVEQGWDVARLLHHLTAKAGLGPGVRPGTRLWIFQTETFSD